MSDYVIVGGLIIFAALVIYKYVHSGGPDPFDPNNK